MKLRKHRLLIVLISLLMLNSLQAQSETNKNSSNNALGILLTKNSYSKEEVNQIINIMSDEANRQIESAYQNGFKAAMLVYVPDSAGLQAEREFYQSENEKLKAAQNHTIPTWQIPIWCAGSFAAGLGVQYVISIFCK